MTASTLPPPFERIQKILKKARNEGRSCLLETEGMEILEAIGISTPNRVFLDPAENFSEIQIALKLAQFSGSKIVLKAVSHEILHKTELGAVKVLSKDAATIRQALMDMKTRLAGCGQVAGFTLSEFIPYEKSLGHELLIGLRFTEDFGPVVTVGAGGVTTEFLSAQFKEGREFGLLSPSLIEPQTLPLTHGDSTLTHAIEEVAVVALATRSHRGQPPLLAQEKLISACRAFLNLALHWVPGEISEFEVNPIVVHEGALIALDALVKLSSPLAPRAQRSPLPLSKIKALVEPQSITLVGVSEGKKDRPSPGRVILENLLKEGFPREKISILKSSPNPIEGCLCYPDVASLPSQQDLVVLAVSALQIPGLIQDLIESQKAESIVVIPGGLEEKEGTEVLVAKMNASLEHARKTPRQGPVINGGNCLGVRSRPGKVNTLFIPEYKLPLRGGRKVPLALISQSGAFAIARLNKLPHLDPKYVVTLGNQMDLRVGDYFKYLENDPELEIFATYVEGFKPGDGLEFLQSARRLTRQGKKVILYRAGRTEAGAAASASHTASIAGNYGVTRALCRQAGVILAESLTEFEDLIRMACGLSGRKFEGHRLGAVSNAGFECVTIADHLGPFELVDLDSSTREKLLNLFEKARISQIVDLHNPLDLTPMCADAEYEQVIATLLSSPAIDVVIVGCIPLTPALGTLPKSEQAEHAEDLAHPEALAARLIELWKKSQKPWAVVIDSGPLYDPFADQLESGGIPVFRSAERALGAFSKLAFPLHF